MIQVVSYLNSDNHFPTTRVGSGNDLGQGGVEDFVVTAHATSTSLALTFHSVHVTQASELFARISSGNGPFGVIRSVVPSINSSETDGVNVHRGESLIRASRGLVGSSPGLDSKRGLEIGDNNVLIKVTIELGVLGEEPLVVTIQQVELTDGEIVLGC